MQAANNDEWKMNDDKTLSILDKTLNEDEYILEKESLPGTETRDIENGNIIVSLNIDIDNDLEIEGIARDILRAIQNKRKELDLDISDKIVVKIFGNSKINETLESYNEYISSNSLAEKLIFDKNTKSEKMTANIDIAILHKARNLLQYNAVWRYVKIVLKLHK